MRHKLNLPSQPNIIVLIIVFDVIALTAIYGLYGTNWVGQAGQIVEIASHAKKPIKISAKAITLEVFSDSDSHAILGKKSIPLTHIKSELMNVIEKHGIEEVLLMIDQKASVRRKAFIIETIQAVELKCSIIYEIKSETHGQ